MPAEIPNTHIEYYGVAQIAPRVETNTEVRFREGENLFDQPPLSWLLVETQLLPPEIDIDPDQETLWMLLLLRFSLRFPLSRVRYREKNEEKIPIRGFSQFREFLKRYSGHLGLSPREFSNEEILDWIEGGKQMTILMESFPLLREYLEAFWFNWNDQVINYFGEALPILLAGERRIPSYDAYQNNQEKFLFSLIYFLNREWFK